MLHFSHIIFDIDGTLTDNTEGYINSMKYALDRMDIKDYNKDTLASHIGPPIQWIFSASFGMNEQDTNIAVKFFREYYNENGWQENIPYKGIIEMMAELYAQGKKMYVATSKVEKFALKIIQHFGMDKYIIQTKGDDYGDGKITKTKVITDLMEMQHLMPSEEIVMVGDTIYDIEGGKKNGISTIAVGYGFGNEKDLRNAIPLYYTANVEELFKVLAR